MAIGLEMIGKLMGGKFNVVLGKLAWFVDRDALHRKFDMKNTELFFLLNMVL